MSPLEIRFARREDENQLQEFIGAHWKKGHILSLDRQLLAWQHAPPDDSTKLNFVLAIDQPTGGIQALLGYIPLRQFDPALPERDIFLAMWKVRGDVKAPGLGVSLLHWLQKNTAADLVCAIGLSQMVVPIYRALGYEVGQLDHHVLLNPAIENFRIARGATPTLFPAPSKPAGKLVTLPAGTLPEGILERDVDHWCQQTLPRKSWHYLLGRYTTHPVYEYYFSFAGDRPRARCLLVWRKIAIEGSACLRIVDLLGDATALADCAGDLQQLLRSHHAEYIDIDHWGVPADSLLQAGFIDRRQHETLIVPAHFEPFEARNIDIGFCYKAFHASRTAPIRLLRGDSDQDRPNNRR
jgi:hypothetical protein